MGKSDFSFLIVSPDNREQLTCEIYYKNEILAEVSQETDVLIIDIFAKDTQKWWSIPLDELQEALEYAKRHLLGE